MSDSQIDMRKSGSYHLLVFSFCVGFIHHAAASPPAATTLAFVSHDDYLIPIPLSTELFVSSQGNDSNPGTIAQPLLTFGGAKAAVASLLNTGRTGNVIVNFRGGTYTLTSTVAFDSSSSGRNGFLIIFRSYPSERAVISGGQNVTGWQLYSSGLNIHRAYVGPGQDFRQLYVNGHHAQRARGPMDPHGFARVATGFTTTDSALLTSTNPTQIEVIFAGNWMMNRCRVASIVGNTLNLVNPCWANSQTSATNGAVLPSWVENSSALLDQPGEFYLDNADGYLYYIPRPGENMATVQVVAPHLQDMITGYGAHDLRFSDLIFEHSAWLQPSSSNGYTGAQSGYHNIGTTLEPMHAPIAFVASRNIIFTENVFTLLGSRALRFSGGSQNIQILNNSFVETAGGAIEFGQIDDPYNADPTTQNSDVLIRNNLISATSFDYFDDNSINIGYAANITIDHNEISDIPGFGISLGWGWDTNSYAKNNIVSNNYIHNFSQRFIDSGAIYTLSAQPGAQIFRNYAVTGNRGFGCFYPDVGSAYELWTSNVCRQVNQWLHIWTASIHDNTIVGNFTDTVNMLNSGKDNIITTNSVVSDDVWPAAAVEVMTSAGLQSPPPGRP